MEETLPKCARFGSFSLDLKAGELRSGSTAVLLQEQPLQVLRILVENEGALVSREEIRKRLWPNDTIVEFEHSINAAINKLRKALGDPVGGAPIHSDGGAPGLSAHGASRMGDARR